MKPCFSIALTVCDGAQYLPELLDSFVEQQLQPCELVVSDDASRDDSLEIIERFALDSPFPVRVLRNRSRLGVIDNFSRSISACTGDYIALADQDDVWRSDKLACLAEELDKSNVLAVFSDAEVVDATLKPFGYTMWQRVRFTPEEQDSFANGTGLSVLLKHRVVTGATLAFKADLKEVALPIPNGWDHDAWLALIAASQGQILAINKPLIAYRQHEENVVGGLRRSLWSQVNEALKIDRGEWYRKEIELWSALDKHMETLRISESVTTLLSEKIDHLESRANFPVVRWRRVPGVVRELAAGRYRLYARNWGSVVFDLLAR
ncbi:glycosyltransferase family 2 protein [Solemya velesiana gill symbiont]|uniref:Glycosyltransferase 2-like domain-containing protein n=1 Tax=Solemya velesiana gill symbiont TaxID=1918948 RepID=A0A1T2KW23_9GAMM|nr:glycosyltransferase family 2 protein [Solemya velesiana gill symbiont]OOZ36946.1 hypothetical protein BOW51_04850 [Solemya velesiana gill symbiont]